MAMKLTWHRLTACSSASKSRIKFPEEAQKKLRISPELFFVRGLFSQISPYFQSCEP